MPERVTTETPLRVRGWKLENFSVANFEAGGIAANVTVIDSATLDVAWDPAMTQECRGTTYPLIVHGADMLVESPRIARGHVKELQLERETIYYLEEADVSCLRLPPGEYVLAYYDPRFVHEKTVLPHHKEGYFEVQISDVSDPQMAGRHNLIVARPSPAPRVPHPLRDTREPVPMPALAHRDQLEPFKVGDTILDISTWRALKGIVVIATTERQAIALPVDSLNYSQAMVDSLLAVGARIMDNNVPRWVKLFGHDVTLQNGQHVTLYVPSPTTRIAGFGGHGFMELILGADSWEVDYDYLYHAIMHEFAHAADGALMHHIFKETGDSPRGEKWSGEGLADFLVFR